MSEMITLWTRQDKNVLKEIEENGTYRVRRDYILQKNDTISSYYLNLYDWYVAAAEKIVPKPNGVTYPIWLSTLSSMHLPLTKETVLLEINVEKDLAVITDFEKWGYVVNYWYVPLNNEDEKKHNEELKKYGIADESSIYAGPNGNFYPMLRNKIIKSWIRMFEVNASQNCSTQATLWEIKREWITNMTLGE